MAAADAELVLVGTPVGREAAGDGCVDQLAGVPALPLLGRTKLVETAMQLVNLGSNVLLFGSGGSGRTAVLHEIARRLQADFSPTVTIVDAAGIVRASELLALSLQGLGITVATDEAVPSVLARIAPAAVTSRVIAIDDVEVTAAHELFGRWRQHLWRIGARWVVVGDGEDPTPYLDGGAEAWWEDGVLAVPPLDPPSARLLASRYLALANVSDEVPTELLRSARGLPRELVRHARGLALDRRLERGSDVQPASLSTLWRPEVEESPPYELSTSEAKFMAVVRNRTFVSLADASLMHELTWSYGKTHGIANGLVQRGILVRGEAPGDLGRPRVVYSASNRE